MKALRWITAVAAMAFALPAQAPGAVGDTEQILYRVSGVFDSGGVFNTGVATAFHCTNFSGVTETIRIVLRDSNATLSLSSILLLLSLTLPPPRCPRRVPI